MGRLTPIDDGAARILEKLDHRLKRLIAIARSGRPSRKIGGGESSSSNSSSEPPSRNSKFYPSSAPVSPMDTPRRNSKFSRKFEPESSMDSPTRNSRFSPPSPVRTLAPEAPRDSPRGNSKFRLGSPLWNFSPKFPKGRLKLGPDSPLGSAKQKLVSLGNKAAVFLQRKKRGEEEEGSEPVGVWQKEILMGERCQPLDFPGVIHYDRNGSPLSTPARSPPRSPLRHRPLVHRLTFPVVLSDED